MTPVAGTRPRRRSGPPAGLAPLSPRRKWRAILVATLALVPAFWSMLLGLVAAASDDPDAPNPAAALAFGLALIPFVFVVLAFMSEHPRPAGAVLRAMGLSLLVGIPVSALAGDAVTGIVAGLGAGGVAALRMDVDHTVRARVLAVVVATAYTFVLVRVAGGLVLLPAPIFPFTAIGIADHLSERSREREKSLT
jgi:purine-cytosine permease-like protein